MAFVVIYWTLMLSPLYPQALTRDMLTAPSAHSVNCPSLSKPRVQPGQLIILMTTWGFLLP